MSDTVKWDHTVDVVVVGSGGGAMVAAIRATDNGADTLMIEKTDKQRGSYYKTFTGTDWTQATNYDLTINTGKTGPEKAVQLILAYIKQREDLGI